MKRIILLVVFSSSIIFSQAYMFPKKDKRETTCAICGKTIYKYEEANERIAFDDYGLTWYPGDSFYHVPDSSAIYNLDFSRKLEVCDKCHKNYQTKFSLELSELWNKIISESKKENGHLQVYYELQRKIEKEKSIKNKIEELQDDLRELNGEPRKRLKATTWQVFGNTIYTDTIYFRSFSADTLKINTIKAQ